MFGKTNREIGKNKCDKCRKQIRGRGGQMIKERCRAKKEEGKEEGKDAQNQTQDWEEKTEKKFIEEEEYEV